MKQGLTSGIEVFKLGRMSSQSDIEILNKWYYERYQIDKGEQFDFKKVQMSNKDSLAVMNFWNW